MRTPSVRVLAPVVLVAVAALAGCTGSEQAQDPSPISAREALQTARPTVEAWNEDAELLITSGFEGGAESPALQRQQRQAEHGVDDGFTVYEDTLPGDGRAPQWIMVFLADGESRSVRVNAEETSWMDERAREAGSGAEPVGNWTVDSPGALERAREASEIDPLLAADDASVFLTLSGGPRGSQWQLRVSSHSVGEQKTLFVDAETGEVRNRTQMQTTQRTASFEGSLEGSDANATHGVETSREGARLAVELAWNSSAAEEGVRLSAGLVSNGTAVEPANSQQTAERFQARWDGLEPGPQRVEVRVDEGPANRTVDYELRVHVAE